MAVRKPLVQIAGQLQELPNGDTLPISYNGGTDPIMSSFAGPLTTFTGTYRYYHPTSTNITGVYCSVGTASSSGSVVIDVKKNGTTIFSGTYPTITASNYLSSLVSITSALTSSDYLTIDVTSAGTGAADLNVYIVVDSASNLASVPATSSSTGVAGTFAYDSSYLYICTATNTWKRVAISTW